MLAQIGHSGSGIPRTLPRNFVTHSNDSARVLLARSQLKRHIPMARRHEWNALTDENWNDVDVEFIDLAGVEE